MRTFLIIAMLALSACGENRPFTDAEVDAAAEIAFATAEDAISESDRIAELEARIDDLESRLDDSGLE